MNKTSGFLSVGLAVGLVFVLSSTALVALNEVKVFGKSILHTRSVSSSVNILPAAALTNVSPTPVARQAPVTTNTPPKSSVSGVVTSSSPSAVKTPPITSKYPEHSVVATVFWIGETASAANAFITNVETAWDTNATLRFGGIDDPAKVNKLSFMPKHNPYYFALPATEFDASGSATLGRSKSYWSTEKLGADVSLFKGRWIKVTVGSKSVFAQWVDVGPNEETDYGYVFGSAKPKNTFGEKAGLDLSPTAANDLGFLDGSKTVSWRFVDSSEVPAGAWTKYSPIDNKIYW